MNYLPCLPVLSSSADSLPSIVPEKKRLFKPAHLVPLILIVFGLLLVAATNYANPWNYLTESLQVVTQKKSQIPCNASSSGQYLLAYEQSFGLFDDISNQMWKIMQRRVQEHQNHKFPSNPLQNSDSGHYWYQQNYEPYFTCPHERRIGKLGDGGKWICNPHRVKEVALERKNARGNGCLVYSVGSSGDFSFEKAVGNLYGDSCEIHTFDPKDYSAQVPESIKDIVHFHAWGVKSEIEMGNETVIVDQFGPFHSLLNTIETLGHSNHTINLFKIDCEGCEWGVYKDWLAAKAEISQIMIELHGVPQESLNLFDEMEEAGYVIFHKEPNTLGCQGNCIEYSFLKLRKDFFIIEEEE